MQSVLAGKPPPVKIEGDVQLAAELGWLAENLRWDAEEDLSRLIGDAPAHAVADAGRRLFEGLKQFLARTPLSPAPVSSVVVTRGGPGKPRVGRRGRPAAKASA
jgi:ubiquinone biosynthesis protein UbiJ